jgi:hypothetical protein
MRSRGLLGLALAGLVLAIPAARADDQKTPEPAASIKPAVLVRLAALDDLTDDLRYLLKQAGQDDIAGQIEAGLKLVTGGQGLAGVDMKKPIGLYATVAAKLPESQVVVLLPISDEKKFLAFLQERDFKAEKGADGAYTLNIDNVPVPLLFRFANGYLYATAKASENVRLPAANRLPKPATVLAGGRGALSLTANIDRLPNQIRKLAVSMAAQQLGEIKEEKLPGETDAQQAARGAVLDEMAARIKMVVEDGGPVQMSLDVDRKKHELSLSFRLAGNPNTKLAKTIAELGQMKSLGAALVGKDSALGGFLNVALPDEIVKKLGPVVDEGFKKGLENQDKAARELALPLAKALEATAKSGRLDFAFDIRGPHKSGKYTFVGCAGVKDGDKIEAALRNIVAKLPEEKRKPIKLDEAKVGTVSIHKVEQSKVDEKTRATLGDGPVYVAIRKDAVLVCVGDDALETLKSAVALEAKGASPAKLEASLSRMAKLIDQTQPGAVAAAKQAFKEKDSDKVSLTVKAGKALEVQISVKTAVITFAGLMDKARKNEQ